MSNDEKLFWDDIDKKIKKFSIHFCGKELSNHPDLQRNLDFSYDSSLVHIYVAHEWGCTPSALSAMAYQDKVDIYAWYIAKKQMEKIDYYEQLRKQERK